MTESTTSPIPDSFEYGERAHAPCSPSTLKPRSVCVGFTNDPNGDKTFADRGTFGHECVEHETPGRVVNDIELAGAVKWCLDFKHKLIGEVYTYPHLPSRVLQEVCLYYFDQWGFTDLVVLDDAKNPRHAELADWKFARNFYHADSGQFWAYCLGLWNRFPTLDTINVHVVHPFLDKVDTAFFSRVYDMERLGAQVAAIIAAWRRNDPADYRVSAQCGYCGAAGKCSKLAKLATEVIERTTGSSLGIPEGAFDGPEITDPAVMAGLLAIRGGLEKAAKEWGRRSLDMYNSGTEIPGYELAERAGRATLGHPSSIYELVQDRLSLPDFLGACKVTKSELLDLYASTFGHGEKSPAKKKLAALLEDADLMIVGDDTHFLRKVKVTPE